MRSPEMTTAKQRAELRVVVRRGDAYALCLRATLAGYDLYCSVHDREDKQVLRSTHHASGKAHTYVYDGAVRLNDGWTVPLCDFRGIQRIWGTAPDLESLDWRYRPKKNSRIRRNLLLDLAEMPQMWSVDLWIIEHGRLNLVAETLASYNGGLADLISFSICDWAQPQLLAVSWSPSQAVTDSFQRYAADHLPPGKLVATVIGPGPPVGPPKTVPRPPSRRNG